MTDAIDFLNIRHCCFSFHLANEYLASEKSVRFKLCAIQIMSENKPYDNMEFDWIQLSADIDPGNTETFLQKWKRKFEENPFVPIGEYAVHILRRNK